jgi:hypothetical protein
MIGKWLEEQEEPHKRRGVEGAFGGVERTLRELTGL